MRALCCPLLLQPCIIAGDGVAVGGTAWAGVNDAGQQGQPPSTPDLSVSFASPSNACSICAEPAPI